MASALILLLALTVGFVAGFAPAGGGRLAGNFPSSRISQTFSRQNFEDTDVLCNSEGGTFTPSSIKKVETTAVDIESKIGSINFPPNTASSNGGEESWSATLSLTVELLGLSANAVSVVQLCDRIDAVGARNTRERWLMQLRRQTLLTQILQDDRAKYLETVKFLGPRVPRNQLPNLQDVPYFNVDGSTAADGAGQSTTGSGEQLIGDCTLPNLKYSESPLDKALLYVFRELVRKEVQWKSETPGIEGLLEEGRHYYISPAGAETENQHAFVRRTLGALLTPFLPPFYRIFMAGIVPSEERGDPKWLASGAKSVIDQLNTIPFVSESRWAQENLLPGKQIGPWFYAPLLTSVVTPPFLGFLVGPSRINRRKDGQVGGMVVEKCKFLQESGCKGLCLHQCKLPAQQFFKDSLGLPLTVSPDFVTQSCQWSWGEEPLPPDEDPSFPKGCLAACPTRSIINAAATSNTLCNA